MPTANVPQQDCSSSGGITPWRRPLANTSFSWRNNISYLISIQASPHWLNARLKPAQDSR
jgi:hypothetical protein